MSGNIRIGQNLREGYNPDGLPGTVALGAAGAPGRAPTSDEIALAVTEYVRLNPIPFERATNTLSESTKFGTGAGGSAGAYVEVGTRNTVNGHVRVVGGDLVLGSSTKVVISSAVQLSGTVNALGAISMNDQRINLRGTDSADYIEFFTSPDNEVLSGTRISTSQSGTLGVSSTEVLRWDTTGVSVTGGMSVTGPNDVQENTSAEVFSDALTTVKDVPAVEYTTTAGDLRRSFHWEQLPDELTNLGYISLMGMIATLWNAVRELEARELAT
jgi:hypothetical protein